MHISSLANREPRSLLFKASVDHSRRYLPWIWGVPSLAPEDDLVSRMLAWERDPEALPEAQEREREVMVEGGRLSGVWTPQTGRGAWGSLSSQRWWHSWLFPRPEGTHNFPHCFCQGMSLEPLAETRQSLERTPGVKSIEDHREILVEFLSTF